MDLLALMGVDKTALEDAKNVFITIVTKIDLIISNQVLIIDKLNRIENGNDSGE